MDPLIVIVFGLPGSGKSYFASRLASMINAVYISSDRVRREILDKRTYSDQEKRSVYNEMATRVIQNAEQNKNIVVDATFHRNRVRNDFTNKVQGNYRIIFIEVVADESLARERLKETRVDSEADFEIYKKIKDEWEKMDEPHLVLRSTNDNIDEMQSKTKDYLYLNNDQRSDK